MVDSDAHLTETVLRTEQLLHGNFLDVRRDTVRLPGGDTATREYIVHPGAVAVVALMDDGQVVMERQFRCPLRRVFLEIPAGKVDPGEAPKDCGIRELAEETGYRAAQWARACVMHNAIAYSTEGIEIWFARGLTAGEHSRDHGEHLDIVPMRQTELEALAARGELTDAKTLVALMWLARWRAGEWTLKWEQA